MLFRSYTIGGKDFVQVAYQSASDAGATYEISTYLEVESTGMGMDKVWSFKDGGDTEVFDGTRDDMGISTPMGADMGATFEMVVSVAHDTTGQYWALESVTQNYRALQVDGLAKYEKDGVRYEHDTVLDTLQALTTEYVADSWGGPDFSFNQPSSTSDLGVGAAVQTDVTLDIGGTDTQVDLYSYTYNYGGEPQQTLVAFAEGTTDSFATAVWEHEVGVGAPIASIADDYDFATNGYTKASGLFYTGDGDVALDTLSIDVKATDVSGAPIGPSLVTDTVDIAVTQLPDSPEVSGPVTLTTIDEDQTVLISQAELLDNATDPDTPLSNLTVQNLTVDGGASKGAVVSVTAYEDVTSGSWAPATTVGLTEISADAARIGGQQGFTYAVFRDDDTNSADYGKLFAYQVLTTDVTTTYMNGFAVSAVPAWAFTPAQDFSGDVSFSYEVADGTAASPANATATITVDAVDDAPEIGRASCRERV